MDALRLPKAEQDQYHQLLNKYRCNTKSQEHISTPAGNQVCTPSPYQTSEDVSICPDCQGSRVEVQLYNYRQLERTCRACMGEGVCRKNRGLSTEK